MKKYKINAVLITIGFLTLLSSCQKNPDTNQIKSPALLNADKVPSWALQKYPFLESVIDVKEKMPRQASLSSSREETFLELDTKPKKKKKIVFRWNGCNWPLGICTIIKLGSSMVAYDEKDKDLDIHIASLAATNEFMSIKADFKFWFEDGTVPITEDIIFDEESSLELGFKSIKILKGLYKMDLSKPEDPTLYVLVETVL